MSKPILFPGQIKRTGERLFERLRAVREFGLRRPCDVCRVEVFCRWYRRLKGRFHNIGDS